MTNPVASMEEKRFEKLREAEETFFDHQISSKSPKIQSVPRILRATRRNFEKYFEPRALANGPIHHHGKYQEADDLKHMLAARFIKDSEQKAEALYSKIKEKIDELRKCYDAEATLCYGDETLAWMLFLDGCSTLEFMYKYDELEDCFMMKTDQVSLAEQDLFLLENQLPFKVLKLLTSSSTQYEQYMKSIESFVQMHIFNAPTDQKGSKVVQFRRSDTMVCMGEEHAPIHLLDLLRTRMLGPSSEGPRAMDRRGGRRRQSFRNVQELKAAGIHLRPSQDKSLRDISFSTSLCFAGYLHLRPIKEDTMPLFLNLIAYEMCPDFRNDFGVTSYMSFLSSLIAHADDVKQLRSARILHNLRGSDEALALLFNEIGLDLVPNTEIYRNVKDQIEKHYKTKWKTWLAQFCDNHFSTPWAIMAFLGALVALGLSVIQTWYTVNCQK